MYAFVHIEKTGGSTLNAILRRYFGARHCDVRLPLVKRRPDRQEPCICLHAADLHRVRRLYRNLRGIAGHHVKPYADLARECPEIEFVTLIRDPVARFRSHFINRARGHDKASFEAWLANGGMQNWQTRMIAGEPNAEKAIELIATRFGFIGLTERFDESLLLLAQWMEEPGLHMTYLATNRTCEKRRPRDIARLHVDLSYLDSVDVRRRIAQANAEDQKVYDFVAATAYPQQVAGYRGDLAAQLARFREQNRCPGPLREPLAGRIMRNYIYKPLLHCHLV